MPKVCILSPYHYDVARGGSEFRAKLLSEHLIEQTDHEVVYLARYVPDQTERYPYEVRGFSGPGLARSLKFGRSPDSIALMRALEDINPDVIVQLVASAYTGIAAFYARSNSKRLIWCLASDKDVDPIPNVGITSPLRYIDCAMFRYGVRHAESIITQTVAQADRLEETFGRTCTAVISNFHPIVDHELIKGAEFRVLWVANLKPLKRPQLFLDLAEHLENCPGIHFRMIGQPEDSPWCDSVLQRASELKNVEYLGGQTMNEVNQQLEAAHLLVNTSEYEGMPNTFIQAWMREVPTLTLGVDPDEVIAKHALGVVGTNHEDIGHNIMKLFRERSVLEKMGKRARLFAESNYSMSNLDKFVEVIEQAVPGA